MLHAEKWHSNSLSVIFQVLKLKVIIVCITLVIRIDLKCAQQHNLIMNLKLKEYLQRGSTVNVKIASAHVYTYSVLIVIDMSLINH